MERKPSVQDLQRTSLALSCRWTSLGLALSFLATIAGLFVNTQFEFADSGAWLPIVNTFANYGVVALLAVAFSQIACYFRPEDVAIDKQARVMARLSIAAAVGYILFVPLFVIASISAAHASAGIFSVLPGCIRFLAMAVGFMGVSRTRNGKESPFLRSSVESPLDYWLKGKSRG